MNTSRAKKYLVLLPLLMVAALLFAIGGNSPNHAYAQDIPTDTASSEKTGIMVVFMPLVTRAVPNQSPTDILLSDNAIQEHQPINTVVGTLSTMDPDDGDTFTYNMVSGTGDTDNESFNISGNQLRSSAVFDYETQNSYSIRIRTTDYWGLYFEKIFTITVIDMIGDLINGNFEQGRVAWTEYSTRGRELIVQEFSSGITPYDGTWAAWLGGDLEEISYIQQQITVTVGLPYMSYYHWIASEDVCGYDYGSVLVNGVAVEVYNLCADTNTGGWVKRVVDLSAYAGQSVEIQIMAECDSALNSNLFIDHVAFQASNFGANQPPLRILNIDASIIKQDVIGK